MKDNFRGFSNGYESREVNLKKYLAKFLYDYGIVVAFIFLCFVLSIASPYFLKIENLLNILRQTSINGLLSIGMTFVILTGGIDLSVGSILAFGGIVGASFSSAAYGGFVYPVFISILIALLGGIILGSINGILIARWKLPPFVVTLGMLSIARGLTYIYTNGMPIPNR